MPPDDDLPARLARLLGETLPDAPDPAGITAEVPLFDGGLELDSFDLVEFISAIEGEFGIRFSEEHFVPETFATLGSLAGVLRSYSA